jgi:hypothetical protein
LLTIRDAVPADLAELREVYRASSLSNEGGPGTRMHLDVVP